MHSAEISVDVSNLQLNNGGQPLFPAPLAIHCDRRFLNIVVGKNGTGKSRILDILSLRKENPASAVVRRIGYENSTDVAYLPQMFFDVFDIRVKDIVRLAASRWSSSVSFTQPNILGFPISSNVELGALSGGQRQLLLFWLVSMQPLRVHIYDEPFRHLDGEASAYVRSTIEGQVKMEKLVIISEHSAHTAWKVPCNRTNLGTNIPA